MSLLDVTDLKFGYLGEVLLNKVNFKLLPNDHTGIVGANGSGKSTFMNLIAHRLIPDSGDIVWDKNVTFSYLDQHLKVFDNMSIEEYLYDVYDHLFKKEEEMNNLYSSIGNQSPSEVDKILNKAYNIQEYLDQNDFYMIKSKISNIINGLGIDEDLSKLLGNLSSGQRAKVFLGKMLLEENDVLLLDEPTNFLDTAHVDWLGKFLVNYKHPFVLISHDKAFLNTVCNVIYSLENKTLTRYKGNYDNYLKEHEVRKAQYEADYNAQQRYIKQTEEFIKKNIVRASTTKRAQSRRKELEKIEILDKPTKEITYKFNFPFSNSFHSEALIVKKLVIGYDKPLLKPINMSINYGDRVVIIGANGIGKSTFVKTILGEIPPLSGVSKMPFYNKVLYFAQEYFGDMNINPLDYFKELYPTYEDKRIRSILGRYGITGDLAIKPFKELSGGEQTKVRFARLTVESSNMLVLDEPSNHLDKEAKKALGEAINEYPGTVILVSHEKGFYESLNMKEIHFTKE